ncbi:MAG TPA: glycosyltransferase, partial [Streptosporangiales bacterium]
LPNMVPVPTRPLAPLDAKVVVAAGRLTRQKGFDMLVDAFARVHEEHPDWQLRIYGQGSLRGALTERIERHGLTGHVRLMGSTRRFEQALRAGSMFVLSSRYEGLPMTVLESMTQGVPVVAFDCHTGPADIVTHGTDGLLVPPERPDELARAMCELIADPDRRRRLGANAYASVARFTAPNVGRRWDRLFAELRPGAPAPVTAVNAAGLGYDET